MGVRNKRPDLNGVLVVDKPLGWTSARVCARVRACTDGAKVGHAGTLDPLATGVLVLCLGKATKAIDRIMAGEKSYRATVDLSAISPTDDLESEPVPVEIGRLPSREDIDNALAGFVGRVRQAPPAHSAILVGGVRAYELARAGSAPVMAERFVDIHEISVAEFQWPRLVLDVRCGKGTYIRSLARDIGRALGTGGVLVGLVRTAVGPFRLEDARAIESVDRSFGQADLMEIPDAADLRDKPLGGPPASHEHGQNEGADQGDGES